MGTSVPPVLLPAKDHASMMNTMAELLWHDLNGRVPWDRIRQVAAEVAAEFRDAKVTLYVPLLIRRYTRERLGYEIRSDQG